MIELKTYHSTKSPEIQGIWQGDQFRLTKIATIAYKILIENAGIFFYNQSAKVRNYFKKSTVTPSVDVKPPFSLTRFLAPIFADLFPITLGTSLFVTLLSRSALSLVGQAIPLRGKATNCEILAQFPRINAVKHLGTLSIALASVAIPCTINFVGAIRKEPKDLPLTTKVTNVVKKQFSAPDFIYYTSMIGLALTAPLYGRTLGLSSKDGFDASDYLMLKTVLAPIARAALSRTAINHPVFSIAFASVYSAIDIPFFMHKILYSHTAPESLAGYAWGLGIVATSCLLKKTCIRLHPPKIAKPA